MRDLGHKWNISNVHSAPARDEAARLGGSMVLHSDSKMIRDGDALEPVPEPEPGMFVKAVPDHLISGARSKSA